MRTIEKPAHIDDRRMRHISDADLFAAMDLSRPGLGAVRNAVEHASWEAAYQAWASYLVAREQPVAVTNLDGYAALDSELRQARIDIVATRRRVIDALVAAGQIPSADALALPHIVLY